jgi:RHH-type transcriptional regulator, proline utilization regulon repressor / proline dehydrogenase / delta 1-pyrroline-5-carboxylate dehydrogenase
VFGPVLHVVRYRRSELEGLLKAIKDTGYGLTLGVHTRIDETIAYVLERAHVGNIYVNRNVVGAVVGVQPFGGEGLSGTGPKAGGPLYLQRLLSMRPGGVPATLANALVGDARSEAEDDPLTLLQAARTWFTAQGDAAAVRRCDSYLGGVLAGATAVLPGPTGERNTYSLRPRGAVLCVSTTPAGARAQLLAALATGNRALFGTQTGAALAAALPAELKRRTETVSSEAGQYDTVLFEGDSDELHALARRVAQRPGAIVTVQGVASGALADGSDDYALERLLAERSVSVNTAAAGGNASLMTIG